jgi:GNAT superfamily N-acetyltransferase
MKIIQANISHSSLIAPLFDAYRQFYKQATDLPLAEAFLTERIEQNESIIFIAIDDEKVVGFTQLYPTFSSVSAQKTLVLNDLFVRPEMRGKGIGEEILKYAQKFAKETNAKGLALETATENLAQKLYEKLGWQKDEGYLHYFWRAV